MPSFVPPSDSGEPDVPNAKKKFLKLRKHWIRNGFLGLCFLFLIGAMVYQPVIFGLAKWGAHTWGPKLGYKIDFEIDGSLWRDVEIKNFELTPTKPDSPIEKCHIGSASASYSLLSLLNHGLSGHWLEHIKAEDVEVVYNAAKETAPTSKPKTTTSEFKLPPLPFPERVEVSGVHVLVLPGTNSESKFELKNFQLSLLPNAAGTLQWDELSIPGMPPLKSIAAKTYYQNRNLELLNLVLDPDKLQFKQVDIDASRLQTRDQLLAIRIHGTAFQSPLVGEVKIFGIGHPPRIKADVSLDHLSLKEVKNFINVPFPLDGIIETVEVRFDGQTDRPESWQGNVEAHLDHFAADALVFDRIDVSAILQNGLASLKQCDIIQGTNEIHVGGQAGLNKKAPFMIHTTMDLNDLALLNPLLDARGLQTRIAGNFKVDGKIQGRLHQNKLQLEDGAVSITSSGIKVQDVSTVEQIQGLVKIRDNKAELEDFQISLSGQNYLSAKGQLLLQEPYTYKGSLTTSLNDLQAFEPLVQAIQQAAANKEFAAKNKTRLPIHIPVAPPHLAGSLLARWNGSGNLKLPFEEMDYAGTLHLRASGVEWNSMGPAEAHMDGTYSPDGIDFKNYQVRLKDIEASGNLVLKDNLLRLDPIAVQQGNSNAIAGRVQIPFELKKLTSKEGPIPNTNQIDVDVETTTPLSLSTLYSAIDKSQASPVEGSLSVFAKAKGRLSTPTANIKVQLNDVKITSLKDLKPANVELNLGFRDKRFALNATVLQPQIQPLTIKGNVPFDPIAFRDSHNINLDSPLQLEATLPRTDLSFLAQASPQVIRSVQGTAAMNVRVNGTLAKPIMSGAIDVDLPAVRAANSMVPTLSNLQARVAFTEHDLNIEKFSAQVGGGNASATGKIDFQKRTLEDTTIDLRIAAQNLLVLRDDNIIARINAAIRVSGPANAAEVAGDVGITKTRVFRDIDIVPINLPGKPAPAPPKGYSGSYGPENLSINNPILKDWKLNLSIKALDPIYVRGNVANGEVWTQMKIQGTAGWPQVSGYIQISNLVTSLPLSQLEFHNANIQLTPDQPLNPQINVIGTSEISNYSVTVAVSGRAHSPQINFSSDPPLPQQDIVSLLATGATTSQLTNNNTALAGKATMLVIQDLYHRAFKKGSALNSPRTSLLDRVSIDVGSTDPTTGKQLTTARIKIFDNWQFIGDVGTAYQSDFRGRLKYLIHFH